MIKYLISILCFLTLTSQAQYSVFSGAETVPLYGSRVDLYWTKFSLFNINGSTPTTSCPGLVQSTSYVQSGLYSFHFSTRNYWTWPAGQHPRQEVNLTTDSVRWQQNFKIGFVYTRPVGQPNINRPIAIAQAQTGVSFGSPPFGFEIQNGYLYIGTNVYDNTIPAPNNRSNIAWRVMYLTPSVKYQFAADLKFRRDPSGYMKFYVNGQQMTGVRVNPSTKVPLSGAVPQLVQILGNTQSVRSGGGTTARWYPKFGIYDWGLQDSYADTTGQDAYLDDIRILDSTYSVTALFYTQPPNVTASADLVITQPATTAHVSSIVVGGVGTISYLWSRVGGPLGGTILSPTVSQTDIQLLNIGVYQYQVRATDANGNSDIDTVQVTVLQAPNNPPVANAGNDTTITSPASSVFLNASLSTDDGTITGNLWSKASGPGSGTITNATAMITTATGLVQGTYIFSYRATDNNGSTNTDTKQVIVLPAIPPSNQPPIADAGGNTTITLPTNSAPLNASASTDPDGTIVATSWSKISGPLAGVITSPTSAITTATGLVAGNYVFRVRVTDNNGDTGIANKTVTVNPAIIPPLIVTITGVDADCNGDNNGSITSNVSGGLAPYSYLYSNGTTTANAGSLVAGIYNLRVTDANNSVVIKSDTINQPDTISINASFGIITTIGGTTTVNISAVGGNGGYSGTGNFTRGTGTWPFTVTDSKGCSNTINVTLSVTTSPMTLTMTPTNIDCAGASDGSIDVTVTGGTAPYKYIWPYLEPDYDSTIQDLGDLPAGAYQLTVQDGLGQTISGVSTIVEPPLIQVTATAPAIQYLGGNTTVTVSATGGTGSLTGTGTFTVVAGTYTYTVVDTNNCSQSATIIIAEGAERPTARKYKIRRN